MRMTQVRARLDGWDWRPLDDGSLGERLTRALGLRAPAMRSTRDPEWPRRLAAAGRILDWRGGTRRLDANGVGRAAWREKKPLGPGSGEQRRGSQGGHNPAWYQLRGSIDPRAVSRGGSLAESSGDGMERIRDKGGEAGWEYGRGGMME